MIITNEDFEYIKEKVNQIEKLLGNMTDVNSRQNRNNLHKAYNLSFRLNKYIKKIEKGGTNE